MSLIPGASTAVPPAETVKVNGSDVPVKIPAQQAKAQELVEGLMKQLAEAKAEAEAAKAAAKSAQAAAAAAKAASIKALQFKVSEKGAVQVNGLGRFPTTLYWQQFQRLICAAAGLTEEQFWTTPMGKFIITNRTALSTKGE